MNCRVGDMRDKEVINVRNGMRIGFVSDIELNPLDARLTAVVVYGKSRMFGLLGHEEDVIIPWKDIKLIGDDTVLVDYEEPKMMAKNRHGKAFLINLAAEPQKSCKPPDFSEKKLVKDSCLCYNQLAKKRTPYFRMVPENRFCRKK